VVHFRAVFCAEDDGDVHFAKEPIHKREFVGYKIALVYTYVYECARE
jgi:hypothetical protein